MGVFKCEDEVGVGDGIGEGVLATADCRIVEYEPSAAVTSGAEPAKSCVLMASVTPELITLATVAYYRVSRHNNARARSTHR